MEGQHLSEAKIHPMAVVEPGARLGAGVRIGAFAWIGAEVTLGDGCVIHHHATVEGKTTMGARNEVFPYAMIGGKTHDLKFKGGSPGLRIGSDNVFREYVTVHMATDDARETLLGNHNHLLAYSHVAHDCVVADHLIMSSHSALGGHVVIGNYVNIGWGVGVHQFVRVGDHAMVGACSKAVQDIPPFMLADGNPAEVRFINKVGMERHGYTPEEIEKARLIHKILYRQGLNRTQALAEIESIDADASAGGVRTRMLSFIASSTRGLA